MFFQTFLLRNHATRSGESPSDYMMQTVEVTALAGTEVLNTIFEPGTVVYVVPMMAATVAADGTITLPGIQYSGAGAAGQHKIAIYGPGRAVQGGKFLGGATVA